MIRPTRVGHSGAAKIVKPRVEEERSSMGGIAETLSQVRPAPKCAETVTTSTGTQAHPLMPSSTLQSIFGESKKEKPEELEHRPR